MQGHSNGALADRLVLNLRTVETHVGNMFTKLDLMPESDVHRRAQRVEAALAYLANRPA